MNNDPDNLVGVICMGIMIMIVSFLLGIDQGRNIVKKEAVIKGFATYTANENGDSVFTWKNN